MVLNSITEDKGAMARRDNATLQEQMARLHQAMSSRDERRQQNAEKRHVSLPFRKVMTCIA